MFLRSLWTALRIPNTGAIIKVMRDWQSLVRIYYLHAALESGLIQFLAKKPASGSEIIEALGVRRVEILDALLNVGLALGELSQANGQYALKGKASLSVAGESGDVIAAMAEAGVTYYHDIYVSAAKRMRGASLSSDLDAIGGVVARFSKMSEPFLRNFIHQAVAGRGPMRILEIGCGSGLLLRSALEMNPQAEGVGLDMDPAVVEQASTNVMEWGIADRCKILAGDIRNAPAGTEGPFDLITLYNIIYYFEEAAREKLFQKLTGLLSPSGGLAVAGSFHDHGTDFGMANLNLATVSLEGCTPLPDLNKTMAQLKTCGLKRLKKMRLMPGSSYFGILAYKA